MEKIPCLVVLDRKSRVIPPIEEMEINERCKWVLDGKGIATVKWDGTACAIIDGQKYARFDAKINKKTGKRRKIPENAIACCDPDPVTGHWPHWVPAYGPEYKYIDEAFTNTLTEEEISNIKYKTFEAIGPKINNNPQNIEKHQVIEHGVDLIHDTHISDKDGKRTLHNIELFLKHMDMEGIVFHMTKTGQKTETPILMAKIRKVDFGLKWPLK